jgi:hypothetical protein
VGYPEAYEFMFDYWYLMKFAGKSPFSFSVFGMKTLAMVLIGREFRKISKRYMPKEGIWTITQHMPTRISISKRIVDYVRVPVESLWIPSA